ncbi:MAG: hypothetical protein LAO31_02475 [Acidobacteriia bacterium]|jgi:hypothetical protein|nr:hypothetical protein [Terriglobia bacterium]
MRVSLETDRGQIKLNPFVERLTGNLLSGVLESLHVPEEAPVAEFVVNGGGARIVVSQKEIPLINAFVKNVLADILHVVMKNLKGTDGVTQATFRLDRGV